MTERKETGPMVRYSWPQNIDNEKQKNSQVGDQSEFFKNKAMYIWNLGMQPYSQFKNQGHCLPVEVQSLTQILQ